jgi:hypothetical protein
VVFLFYKLLELVTVVFEGLDIDIIVTSSDIVGLSDRVRGLVVTVVGQRLFPNLSGIDELNSNVFKVWVVLLRRFYLLLHVFTHQVSLTLVFLELNLYVITLRQIIVDIVVT